MLPVKWKESQHRNCSSRHSDIFLSFHHILQRCGKRNTIISKWWDFTADRGRYIEWNSEFHRWWWHLHPCCWTAGELAVIVVKSGKIEMQSGHWLFFCCCRLFKLWFSVLAQIAVLGQYNQHGGSWRARSSLLKSSQAWLCWIALKGRSLVRLFSERTLYNDH